MKDPATVPLCGRESELARFDSGLDETLRGEPRFVWLCGETGAGKSRLLTEVTSRLNARGHLTLHTRAVRGATDYALLSELIRPFLLAPGHARRLRVELPAEMVDSLSELLPASSSTGRTRPRLRAAPPTAARTSRSHRVEAIIGFLAWLAHRRPLALLIDDLHEAPDEVCSGLRHLLVRTRRAPLLLAAALRSDEITPAKVAFATELEVQHILLRIELSPLGSGEIHELVGSLFDPELARDIGDWLVDASRGNPLFAVEILRLLTEKGTIARSVVGESGAWELRGTLPETAVPPLLATLIADRFGRLDAEAQCLAAALTVHGGAGPVQSVARAAHLGAGPLSRALAHLARGHWVVTDPLGQPRDPIGFAHPLAERVIYDNLLAEKRRALHARFARQPPPRGMPRDQAEARFAQHAARSGEPALRREALRPALSSASAAAQRGEATRAVALYEVALDLVPDLKGSRRTEVMVSALLGHAGALYDCGRLAEAEKGLERAADLARTASSSIPLLLEARVLRHLGDVRAGLGDLSEGIKLLEEAYRRAAGTRGRWQKTGVTDPAVLEQAARAAIRLVFVHFQRGEFERALACGRRARPLVEALARPDLHGFLLNNIGLVYWSTGRLAEAARAFARHLEIAEGPGTIARNRVRRVQGGKRGRGEGRVGRPASSAEIAYACSNLGLIYWNLGQIEDAGRCFKRAIDLHRASGRLLSEAGSLQNLALLLEERGDYEAAARLNHQVLDTVRRLGDRRAAMQIWGNLGGNYFELGRYDEARAYLERARADAEELGIPSTLPDILVGLARLEIQTGNPAAGRDHAAEAVRLSRELRLPFDHGRSLRSLALAEAALDSQPSALRHLRESGAILSRIGAELEVAKSAFEEGLLLARTGAVGAARRRVEGALAAFRARGLTAREAAARAAAGKILPDRTPTLAAPESVKYTDPGTPTPPVTGGPFPERLREVPASYRIECFGPLRVFRPHESEPIPQKQWGSHKAQQILAYILACDPTGRGVIRERILAAVWPEAPADTLGHTFHVTVSHLRRALSGSAQEVVSPLAQEGGLYRLSWPGPVWVDTSEFASALSRAGELEHADQICMAEAELQRAVGLVHGDFLDDVHFEWAEALRVKYRQDYFQVLRKLARWALARWDFATARGLASRLLSEEPLDEAAHRIVIQSLLEEDRQAEALAQYRYCARLLKRVLGIEPSPETTALLGRTVRRSPGMAKDPSLA